jgi:hypothetical protein
MQSTRHRSLREPASPTGGDRRPWMVRGANGSRMSGGVRRRRPAPISPEPLNGVSGRRWIPRITGPLGLVSARTAENMSAPDSEGTAGHLALLAGASAGGSTFVVA